MYQPTPNQPSLRSDIGHAKHSPQKPIKGKGRDEFYYRIGDVLHQIILHNNQVKHVSII